jgi:hypothetical protein
MNRVPPIAGSCLGLLMGGFLGVLVGIWLSCNWYSIGTIPSGSGLAGLVALVAVSAFCVAWVLTVTFFGLLGGWLGTFLAALFSLLSEPAPVDLRKEVKARLAELEKEKQELERQILEEK